MSNTPSPAATREERLHEILAEYLQAVDAGQQPLRQEFLDRHPDLAEELREFFTNQDQAEALAGPLGPATRPNEPTVATAGPPVLAPGTSVRYLGDYELLEPIARGGMGVVYHARQVSLNRIVALKMILAGQLASPTDVRRFHTEARAVADLDHPNIVPIYEVGEYEEQHYFSMKLMEGGSLAAQVQRREPGTSREQQRWAAQVVATVARAVQHAHQRGILHRDLKPANILLDAQGQPHVTDFGLARSLAADSSVTQTGAILGTPSYMAPEQAAGHKAGATTLADVYSLGAILYELLTGRPPFRGETPLETLQQVQEQPPVPPRQLQPGLDRDLETVCLKCLEKDSARRYNSAADLAEDLERWLAGEPIRARAGSVSVLVWAWFRKNLRATFWTVAIALLCFGPGTALLTVAGIEELLANCARAYDHFPSLTPPALSTHWVAPPWMRAVAGLLGVFLVGNMGLALAWIVQPRDRAADLVTGLASGLLGGIAAFLCGIGWAVVLALVVVPSLEDIRLFHQVIAARAAARPDRADEAARLDLAEVVAQRYPDLRALPPPLRVDAFSAKIVTDQVMAAQLALWVGVCGTFLAHVAAGVIQVMAAGYLRRRGGSLPAVWPEYVELSVPAQGMVTVLLFAFFNALVMEPFVSIRSLWLALVMMVLLTALGLVGVSYRWPPALRFLAYAAWLTTWLRTAGGWSLENIFPGQVLTLPWYLDATAYAGLVVLLAYYYDRCRQGHAAGASP